MVLVSIKAGSQAVHVRVDDLEPREREQVHRAVECIQRITGREGSPGAVGLVAILLAMAVMAFAGAISGFLEEEPFRIFTGVVMIVTGVATAAITARVIYGLNGADAEVLGNLVKDSRRSRELLEAYMRARPEFRRLLQGCVPLPSAVPST